MIRLSQIHLVTSSKIHNVKWPIYNQSLVRHGELLLAFDVIDNLDLELKQMNKDKMEDK